MAAAEWKKVIVSGSSAHLSSLQVGSNQFIGTTQATTSLTGSFTGSFSGSGAGLTGVIASSPNALTAGSGLSAASTYDGSVARTFTVDSGSLLPFFSSSIFTRISGDITINSSTGVAAIGSGKVTSAMILDGTIADGDIANTTISNTKLVNSSITIGNTSTALGATSTTLTGLTSVTSTTFVGNLTGTATTASFVLQAVSASFATSASNAATVVTNANLTGNVTSVGNATTIASGVVTSDMIVNNTIVNADINTAAAIADTKLDTIATALKVSNSATTATSANTVNAIVARDASGNFSAGTITATNATITGDLTVSGTTTILDTTNLSVEDRFVVLNHGSGSVVPSQEGGIIVEGSTAGSGSAFYYDGDTVLRWGVALGVADNATSVTANSYAVTVSGSGANPAGNPTYGGSAAGYGNMYVNTTENTIWIFA